MKKRKMSAHLNISIAKMQRYGCITLQKDYAIIEYAKFMREALGTRRKQRYRMFLYRQRESELCV